MQPRCSACANKSKRCADHDPWFADFFILCFIIFFQNGFLCKPFRRQSRCSPSDHLLCVCDKCYADIRDKIKLQVIWVSLVTSLGSLWCGLPLKRPLSSLLLTFGWNSVPVVQHPALVLWFVEALLTEVAKIQLCLWRCHGYEPHSKKKKYLYENKLALFCPDT